MSAEGVCRTAPATLGLLKCVGVQCYDEEVEFTDTVQ